MVGQAAEICRMFNQVLIRRSCFFKNCLFLQNPYFLSSNCFWFYRFGFADAHITLAEYYVFGSGPGCLYIPFPAAL